MPSFDIVSRVNLAEIDNALDNMRREISTRYDFKQAKCSIERNGEELLIMADDDMKLRQMHELLQGHLARRKVSAGVLDYKEPQRAAGQALRQGVIVRTGIDQALARQIVKSLRDSKLKVQPAIQGDEVRVAGKKRDDLQAAIEIVKEMKTEQPMQFINFRD